VLLEPGLCQIPVFQNLGKYFSILFFLDYFMVLSDIKPLRCLKFLLLSGVKKVPIKKFNPDTGGSCL
jgi:hypothetical protein